ncbi:thyroid transcription factor 1-associated protein 26 homolog [Latimeria chalumnae]|uniref:thyroid transcription factor 1-associated protein 26 homolog n=1 Tax=Latimeria chalumnae TaxID=7897 RepID=UPI0003C1010A|nr:PREDICTED: thyroid transcription factor 1-associated protein 26 [Latimeria chalumnae]|eukprot:XP_005996068.1 PREDICTED: thyroid transcription factor 1-associated protein 26 [Latimeria chalumnae]
MAAVRGAAGSAAKSDKNDFLKVRAKSSGKTTGHAVGNLKRKTKYRPDPAKTFVGSVKEGQGFAFKRKQKIQQNYRRLLQKGGKGKPQAVKYTDYYPEHLKHLYLAEEELLKKSTSKKGADGLPENEPDAADRRKPDVRPKNFKRKTSYQKTQEEYERRQAERAKKRAEAKERQQQREESQRLYKQKKLEAYKILSKKTKKGQPNFNAQMEYLLQKIQNTPKQDP